MPTMTLNNLKDDYPGKSDKEIAKAIAKKYGYKVIVRYKHPSSSEFDKLGCCQSPDQAIGYLNNPNCKNPEIIYGPGATLEITTLAILFDIDKIEKHFGPGNYLVSAWEVVWRVIGVDRLKDLSGSLLYECDTKGNERGCCVAIRSFNESLLHEISDLMSSSVVYQEVADKQMFLENEIAGIQPLMDAGTIDRDGSVTGKKAYCAALAFEKFLNKRTNIKDTQLSTKRRWQFWKL